MPVIKEKIMENPLFWIGKRKSEEGCHIFSLPIPSGYLQLTARIKFAEENAILPVGLEHVIKVRRRWIKDITQLAMRMPYTGRTEGHRRQGINPQREQGPMQSKYFQHTLGTKVQWWWQECGEVWWMRIGYAKTAIRWEGPKFQDRES